MRKRVKHHQRSHRQSRRRSRQRSRRSQSKQRKTPKAKRSRKSRRKSHHKSRRKSHHKSRRCRSRSKQRKTSKAKRSRRSRRKSRSKQRKTPKPKRSRKYKTQSDDSAQRYNYYLDELQKQLAELLNDAGIPTPQYLPDEFDKKPGYERWQHLMRYPQNSAQRVSGDGIDIGRLLARQAIRERGRATVQRPGSNIANEVTRLLERQ